jgi:hypothetical protein
MGKYEPLAQFLRKQRADEIRLTFAEIERIIGARLPPSARKQRAWWSNNPHNSVMTKVWLAVGFRSEQVDMAERKLVLRREQKTAEQRQPKDSSPSLPTTRGRHPLLGAMKGLVHIMPGTDLTEPADPDWGRD